MARRGKRGRKIQNTKEHELVRSLDELAEYEEYRSSLLKQFYKAIQQGKSSKEILEMAKTVSAARLGTIAATTEDESKALSAIKDILDRTDGKAKEIKEISHKFENLSDEELDAIIISEQQRLSTSKSNLN